MFLPQILAEYTNDGCAASFLSLWHCNVRHLESNSEYVTCNI